MAPNDDAPFAGVVAHAARNYVPRPADVTPVHALSRVQPSDALWPKYKGKTRTACGKFLAGAHHATTDHVAVTCLHCIPLIPYSAARQSWAAAGQPCEQADGDGGYPRYEAQQSGVSSC